MALRARRLVGLAGRGARRADPLARPEFWESIAEQVFDDLLGTNLKVPMFLAQAAVPELRKLVLMNVPIAGYAPLSCTAATWAVSCSPRSAPT